MGLLNTHNSRLNLTAQRDLPKFNATVMLRKLEINNILRR